jgi:hypothetical protein
MQTETQKLVAQWQAKQGPFAGKHDTHIGGKVERQAAKKALIRKAAQG